MYEKCLAIKLWQKLLKLIKIPVKIYIQVLQRGKIRFPCHSVSIDYLLVCTVCHPNIVVLVVGLWKARIECSQGHHPLMVQFVDNGLSNAPFTLPVVRLMVRSFSWQWNLPQVAPFHSSCPHCSRQPLITLSFLTVNNSRMTVLQTMVTEEQPPLT